MAGRFRRIVERVPLLQRRLKKKARLLLNPISGEGQARKTFRQLQQQMLKHLPEYNVDICFSRKPGDLGECAREAVQENYSLVMIAGGDGAINETIQGMAESSIPLGIIPKGTANIFAEEMGIPRSVEKALQIIREGVVKRIDLGKANDRYFLWLSGIGLDAKVAHEVHMDIKDRLGALAYIVFAFRHIRSIPSSFVCIRSGTAELKEHATTVVIGNTASYDGNLKIRATEQMNDGFLDVCVVRRLSLLYILRGMLFFMLGRRAYYRDVKYLDVHYFKARDLIIESEPPVFVHIDGEILGKTPVHFQAVPSALSLILPSQTSISKKIQQ